MSATLVSSNTTIKVNGGERTITVPGASQTVTYTIPANSYMILQGVQFSTNITNFQIRTSGGNNYVNTTATTLYATGGYYIGAGSVLATTTNLAGGGSVVLLCVEFTNTP